MGHTNEGVAFVMIHLQVLVNVRRALAQRSAVDDLAATIPITWVALSLLLLTMLDLRQRAGTHLVRV